MSNENKSARQIQIESVASRIGLPLWSIKGVVIPDDQDVERFLNEYHKSVQEEIERAENRRRPGTLPPKIKTTEAERKAAEGLLNDFEVRPGARVGETSEEYRRRKAESEEEIDY